MISFFKVLRRDCAALIERGQPIVLSCGFLVLASTLYPFAIGPDQVKLAQLAPGIVWVLALFLGLLHLEKLYGEDAASGALEQLAAAGVPAWWFGFTRSAAHWLMAFMPLIILTPALLIILGVKEDAVLLPVLSLLVGTPALSFIGSWGAALTLGARQSVLVVTLVVFPLMIPTLIFGVSAAAPQFGSDGAMSLCLAVTLLSAVICPIATHLSLRASLE
ncbi:MAG: heme exporter protein CcmB [Pseudomonadota bacterium]